MSAPAYAYIDPSAGSLWIQSLIAVVATLGTLVRAYWQQIKLKIISIKNYVVKRPQNDELLQNKKKSDNNP